MAENAKERTERLGKIYTTLEEQYPDANLRLRFNNPLELLVASILAAQCTDDRVNQVTPSLFEKYRTAADYANASAEVLEQEIRSIPMCRRKARQIIESCEVLVKEHDGQVPADIDALTSLKGVGRKTANLILGNAYGIAGVVVDTHVMRISKRLALSKHEDRDKVEQDLIKLLPEEKWIHFSHLLGALGRDLCKAPFPKCRLCLISRYCPFFDRLFDEQLDE